MPARVLLDLGVPYGCGVLADARHG